MKQLANEQEDRDAPSLSWRSPKRSRMPRAYPYLPTWRAKGRWWGDSIVGRAHVAAAAEFSLLAECSEGP